MRVTFLAHAGFLVELDTVTLLFDWWKEPLPPLPDKPLLVFVSHRHKDHFKPEIFTLPDTHPDTHFLLGSDFHLTERMLARWHVSPSTAARCRRCGKHDVFEVLPGITVETFPSTDAGVAWMATADGISIFHAGDLNWWHWAEESEEWNRNMEHSFKSRVESLRGRTVELAMLPLDPRQGADGFLGPRYFLELMRVRHFLPMHQWDHPEFTEQFLAAYPQYAPITTVVHHPSERWEFERGS